MAEWKLFDGDVPHVSTFEFHEHRERAPHLEQPGHRERLLAAAALIAEAAAELPEPRTFSDLGCGDGGLLSVVQGRFAQAWGYDFAPANAAGWAERGVAAARADAFHGDHAGIRVGDVAAATEVLEHLADPREALRWIAGHAQRLVCSSPWDENDGHRDPVHAWAWDMDGYASLIESCGWQVARHEQAGRFQVVLGHVR
ncbi:MAG: class I SAM-dependent methyltransferase [Actinomycetota bacterium]|nr:class I SAM-dependent methyltransferase [Actinomycetota bacterium]